MKINTHLDDTAEGADARSIKGLYRFADTQRDALIAFANEQRKEIERLIDTAYGRGYRAAKRSSAAVKAHATRKINADQQQQKEVSPAA